MRQRFSPGSVRMLAVCLVSVSFSISPLLAQQLGTSIIGGEIFDPQGAVVRAAQVTVVQKSTRLERTTITNGAGLFAINNLAPGEYELKVAASGFAEYVKTVQLEVGQQADLKVRVGVQQQREVININELDDISLVETASSTVDGVITSQQIDNLPLNGRNFLELSLLTPGNAIAPNFDPTKNGTVVISSAGQLGRGGNISIDGMDDNDDVVGGMLLNVPEDSVQEFQVATNRFSAEMGRTGSAVVNVVTKSGSNTLHGSASFYERHKSLQAATPIFNPTGGFTAPADQSPNFRREQYSGTLGGPLVRDKAWWFGAFEYRDQLSGAVVGTRNLSTQKIDTSFASVPLHDPMGTIRGDWKISDRDTLTLHYSIERLGADGTSSFLSGQPIGSVSERQNLANHFQTFQTSWTRTLTSNLLNRASYAFNNFINATTPLTVGPELDFPSIADGSSYRVPQQTRQKRSQFNDNLDWIHGRHYFHFGGEFQRVGADFNLGVFQAGAIEFVQDFANADRTGDGIIDDRDLLFAVAIRSAVPQKALIIPDADNNFTAAYFRMIGEFIPN